MQPDLPLPAPVIVNFQPSFFRQKRFFIIVFTVFLGLAFGLFVLYKQGKINFFNQRPSMSADILEMTTPTKSLNGVIEKIEGNTITVSQQNQDPSKKLLYKVIIGSKTVISRPPTAPIPYLFKTTTSASASASKLIIKDIEVGEMISVFTGQDLRLLIDRQFEADSVALAPKTNFILGNIIEIKGDDMKVKTISEKPIDYQVKILLDTEISYSSPSASLTVAAISKKLASKDLKTGMKVVVYYDSIFSKDTTIQARRIDPTVSN